MATTRDRMVLAAAGLFREQGYDGTGFRDVVKAAGTSQGVIYHHFPGGKSELGVAVSLATLLSPLAVILPFVDSGLAKDANCAALLADGAAEGAPVKTARAGTPKAR